jgi:hypothetical protein
VRQSLLLEEALAVPLDAVAGDLQLLTGLVEEVRHLGVAPAEDALQGEDAPAQPLGVGGVELADQQEGAGGGGGGGLEALALVLGQAQHLGGLAVEGIEVHCAGELAGGGLRISTLKQ